MEKQFVLPFRLGKKQSRSVLDANGKEVVVFPKGCEYLASEYIETMNNKLHSYKFDKTAGEIAKEFKCAVGKIGFPNCGIVVIGAIYSSKCQMCDTNMFNIIKQVWV